MNLSAKTKIASVAAAAALLSSSAWADITLNPNFSLSGYVAGSVSTSKFSGIDDGAGGTFSTTTSTLDMNATKLALAFKFAPVSGTVSVYSGSNNKPVILDSYATYDLGGGTTITGGNFLSWLGYEAFDIVNLSTISYAWDSSINFDAHAIVTPHIPGYHTGVKIENSTDKYAMGVAILDSAFVPVGGTALKGDGNLKNGPGFEAYAISKSDKLTAFIGAAYDKDSVNNFDQYSVDSWVQYVLGDTTVAGELAYYKYNPGAGSSGNSTYWGIWGIQKMSDSTSVIGRISGADAVIGNGKYLKFTLGGLFKITPNLDIKLEGDYTSYSKSVGVDKSMGAAAQAVFHF